MSDWDSEVQSAPAEGIAATLLPFDDQEHVHLRSHQVVLGDEQDWVGSYAGAMTSPVADLTSR